MPFWNPIIMGSSISDGEDSFTFVASEFGATPTITIPAARVANDVCIIYNRAHNNGGIGISTVVPAGFTSLQNRADTSGISRIRGIISAKVLDGTETTVTGMNSNTDGYVAAVFRPTGATYTGFTANSIKDTSGGGDPAAQTITAAAETDLPIILYGQMTGRGGTSTPGGIVTSPTMTQLTSETTTAAHYRIYAASPADTTYDMDNSFARFVMQSGYLTFS